MSMRADRLAVGKPIMFEEVLVILRSLFLLVSEREREHGKIAGGTIDKNRSNDTMVQEMQEVLFVWGNPEFMYDQIISL